MNLNEYAALDAHGLADLIASRQVTPKEVAQTAAKAIAATHSDLNAVIETYPDRIATLDEASLGAGPFRGVPTLMKDVFGHEKGRLCEFGSRLCKGMVTEIDSFLVQQMRAVGLNIIGRSAAPEYSMSSTTESIMFGNTSTPWKHGYSAGGSSGGAAAAVAAGVVPLAHGSDIGGSIRIPASYCGGVGMKPSRGRIPLSPLVDEGGLGFSTNLVQTRTVRDAAVMLDWLSKPQLGDPFVIPKPADTYAKIARQASGPLRVALITNAIAGAQPDAEVVAATDAAAKHLAGMGHAVDTFAVDIGGIETLIGMNKLFFFGFADRLDGYAKRMGRSVNGDTIEPVMLKIYNWSRTLTTADYFAAVSLANIARRKAAQVFAKHDVWLSPTTARTAEPWGRYHLARKDVEPTGNLATEMFAVPCQYTIPHNLMGTPAISLPLALHSNGLPIGVQIAARPAEDHIVLQLATALEAAMPWRGRVPALHVSNKG